MGRRRLIAPPLRRRRPPKPVPARPRGYPRCHGTHHERRGMWHRRGTHCPAADEHAGRGRQPAGGGEPYFGRLRCPRYARPRTRPAAGRRRWCRPASRTTLPCGSAGPKRALGTTHGLECARSSREAGAAPLAAAAQQRAPGAGPHPTAEAVLLLAPAIVRLERPFHAWPPRRPGAEGPAPAPTRPGAQVDEPVYGPGADRGNPSPAAPAV